MDRYFAQFFEDGTKVKIPFEIEQFLRFEQNFQKNLDDYVYLVFSRICNYYLETLTHISSAIDV